LRQPAAGSAATPKLPAQALSNSDPLFAGCRLRAGAASTMVAAAAIGTRARAAALFGEGVASHLR